MKAFIACWFILCVALAAHCAGSPETVRGKVVAIADGDTITVLQEETQVKVRLHGVDSPEKGQDFGKVANDFTAEHCFGEEVTVVVTDVDRYGRSVGLVILDDGRVLNHELVAAGLAHWYERYARRDLALERLQAEAKAAKRGLWSRPNVVTPEAFRSGEGSGRAEPYNPPSATSAAQAGSPATAASLPDAETVYTTDTGTKYHRDGCRFLRASKRAVSVVEARTHFEACKICRP